MFSKVSGAATVVGFTLISIIVTVLIAVNFLSGIVGGIWLAIKGQWGSIGWGFALGCIMPWVWMLASLPSMGLAFLVGLFADKGSRVFTAIFGFLGSMYSNILVAFWVFYAFDFFMGRASSDTYIPYLLWGYSSMMAPLSYMASKEPPDSTGTSLALFCAQLSFLVLTLFWFWGTHPKTIIATFSCIILVFSLFAVFLAVASMPPRYVSQADKYGGERKNPEVLAEDINGRKYDHIPVKLSIGITIFSIILVIIGAMWSASFLFFQSGAGGISCVGDSPCGRRHRDVEKENVGTKVDSSNLRSHCRSMYYRFCRYYHNSPR